MAILSTHIPATGRNRLSLPAAMASALAVLAAHEVERVAIQSAMFRILAAPLVAPENRPNVSRATIAGYALASHDLIGVSGYSPVLLVEAPQRVLAGDPLSHGLDCVLPEDAVASDAGVFTVTMPADRWENVRRVGDDVAAGTVLAPAGTALSPMLMALAQACEVETVTVVRIPFVIHAEEEYEPLGRLLNDLLGRAGASLSEEAGLKLTISGSGNPAAIGLALTGCDGVGLSVSDRVALHLPPVVPAILGTALGLVIPLIDSLSGRVRGTPVERPVVRKISSQVGVSAVALLRETRDGFEPLGSGPLSLAALAQASHCAIIAAESEGLAAGDIVGGHEL